MWVVFFSLWFLVACPEPDWVKNECYFIIFYAHSASHTHVLCKPAQVRSHIRSCGKGRKPALEGATTLPESPLRFVQDLINWGAVDWDHSLAQWDLFIGCNYLHTPARANLPPCQVKTMPFVYSLLVLSFRCFLINFPLIVVLIRFSQSSFIPVIRKQRW